MQLYRSAFLSLALGLTLALPNLLYAQSRPAQLSVGLHVPTIPFASAEERLRYAQSLAKFIEQRTGIPTVGRTYSRYRDLQGAKPDLAVISPICVAARAPGTVIASAVIAGSTSQPWAIYSTQANSLQELRGKRMAQIDTGCREADFLTNGVLRGEIRSNYFSKLVGKLNLSSLVSGVKSYGAAEGFVAPVGSYGLSELYRSPPFPTPALVAINKRLPADVVSAVRQGAGQIPTSNVISGWSSGGASSYRSLGRVLRTSTRRPILSRPVLVDFLQLVKVNLPPLAIKPTPPLQLFSVE